ncbi:AraC family transcriptional regulator [Pseudacidovorax intermedius]|uniref:AraC family transcriptional regulator n=1 Tax=Pseudacidovorax intermedius TaxID=433924 RepID=UPI000734D411|nr:AraC family transcriptional regulator [Pseudacidovorax intermedius]
MAKGGQGHAGRDDQHADLAPVLLRLLAARIGAGRVRPDRLMRGMGFGPDDLAAPDFNVSYRQCVEVLRRYAAVAELSLEEALRLGGRLGVVSLGHVGLGMMASADIHDMFRLLAEFHRSAGFPLAVEEAWVDGEFGMVVQPRHGDTDVEPFLVAYTLAALQSLTRQVLGTDFRPRSVSLALARPADASVFDRVFGCRVKFDAGLHRLGVGPALPVHSADACVALRMREVLEQASPRQALTDHGAAVAQVIRRHTAAVPTFAQIAGALNMTERTLRRKLFEEGLTYRGLLAEERRLRTLALVRGTRASMQDVAEQTGYGSPRSLRRAVQRWTGQGPRAERKAAAHRPAGRPPAEDVPEPPPPWP